MHESILTNDPIAALTEMGAPGAATFFGPESVALEEQLQELEEKRVRAAEAQAAVEVGAGSSGEMDVASMLVSSKQRKKPRSPSSLSPATSPATYSPRLMDFLSECLIKNPANRKSALQLRNHDFFELRNQQAVSQALAKAHGGADRPISRETSGLKEGLGGTPKVIAFDQQTYFESFAFGGSSDLPDWAPDSPDSAPDTPNLYAPDFHPETD
jgi:serine/threonine protein kinase